MWNSTLSAPGDYGDDVQVLHAQAAGIGEQRNADQHRRASEISADQKPPARQAVDPDASKHAQQEAPAPIRPPVASPSRWPAHPTGARR